jgi:putative ABC transport system substrate-binding protein
VRRRDFTIGLLLSSATGALAQEHRIAIVIPAGPVALISETGHPFWRAIFGELRRLGDVEGQNLTVERFFGAPTARALYEATFLPASARPACRKNDRDPRPCHPMWG